MNRRFFLSRLALLTAPVIVPAPLKTIFDLGAHKHRSLKNALVLDEWEAFVPIMTGDPHLGEVEARYELIGSEVRMDIRLPGSYNETLQKYYSKFTLVG
jgi:hypothetical protein